MSVVANEIVCYGCADMPEADGSTVGGAVDFSKRISFFDMASAGTVDYVSSSSSDTATKIEIAGRDATGVIQTETKTLSGTTIVTGAQSFARLLYGAASGAASGGPLADPGGTTAVGDLAVLAHTRTISGHTAQSGSASKSGATPVVFHLQSGDGATIGTLNYGGLGLVLRITGGTGSGQIRYIAAQYNSSGAYGGSALGADYVVVNRDWTIVPDATSTYDIAPGMVFEISPNQVTAVIRAFSTAAADVPDGSDRVFYEKFFLVNNDTATALTSATVEILSETPSLPSDALLDLGAAGSLDDGGSATNRQTAPSGISFVTQPATISLSNNLPSGSAPNSAGAQGLWARLTLPAGAAAYNGTALLRTQGTTT